MWSKPRVERTVQYVRGNFFAGENFQDLNQAQAAAKVWCSRTAGMRIHGTTNARPLETYNELERAVMLPVPRRYDVPILRAVKVHRDFHIEIGKALYSVPGEYIGRTLDARADSELVKLFYRGRVVKIHPRQPAGGRWTDPNDLPAERVGYAMRDLDRLRANASQHGENVGIYAARLLDDPLPWTRMRAVYRLLGLVRRYGPGPVDAACGTALDLDVVSVAKIDAMLVKALERATPTLPAAAGHPAGRFSRDAGEFRSPATLLTLVHSQPQPEDNS